MWFPFFRYLAGDRAISRIIVRTRVRATRISSALTFIPIDCAAKRLSLITLISPSSRIKCARIPSRSLTRKRVRAPVISGSFRLTPIPEYEKVPRGKSFLAHARARVSMKLRAFGIYVRLWKQLQRINRRDKLTTDFQTDNEFPGSRCVDILFLELLVIVPSSGSVSNEIFGSKVPYDTHRSCLYLIIFTSYKLQYISSI